MGKSDNFETKLNRLEDIVAELENQDLDLDTTLKKFKEGMDLGKECRKMLKSIELEVNKVLSADDAQEPETESFDGDV